MASSVGALTTPSSVWPIVEALATSALAVITTLSLPVIIVQAWLARRVHIEEVIERSVERLMNIRADIRALSETRQLGSSVSAESVRMLGVASMKLYACVPALRAEIRLYGVKASVDTIGKFIRDIKLIQEYSRYITKQCRVRLERLEGDFQSIVGKALEFMEASEEDANAVRSLLGSDDRSEKLTELMRAIAIKLMVRRGASAGEIAAFESRQSVPSSSEDIAKFFAEWGGDLENSRLLSLWLNELEDIDKDLKDLVKAVNKILGRRSKRPIKVRATLVEEPR